MASRPWQCATIAVAFLVGRAGGTAATAGSANQEASSRSDAMVANRLPIAKDKPAAEGCRTSEDIGKVRVYVGDSHYVVGLTYPTYPPSRKPRPAEPRPSLWFCAWDQTDPAIAAWYEVPGTLAEIAESRRR